MFRRINTSRFSASRAFYLPATVSLATIIFMLCVYLAQSGASIAIDRTLVLWAHDTSFLSLNDWQALTALGDTLVLALFGIIAAGGLWLSDRPKLAGFLILSFTGGRLLTTLLKDIIARSRPDIVVHSDYVTSASLPSAHTMMSTITVILLLGILKAFPLPRPLQRYLYVAAAFFAFLIGASRLFLGVHWPTDIIAGWAGGLAWGLLCVFLGQKLNIFNSKTT